MGAFLKQRVRAAWKKVGTFVITDGWVGGGPNGGFVGKVKVGGDVVTYLCTPQLEVIHAIPGNVPADRFLAELKWAVELAGRLNGRAGDSRTRVAKEAHEAALQTARPVPQSWTPHTPGLPAVHRKLAELPLPRLDSVFRFFFEKILRQKLSDAPVQRKEGGLWDNNVLNVTNR